MNEYPEHEKLRAIQDKSQAIGEFLDWLQDGGFEDYGNIDLCYRPLIKTVERIGKDGYWRQEPLPEDKWFHSDHLTTLMTPKSILLAAFFEIDLKKLEEEKVQMLDEQRSLNSKSKMQN